MIATINGVTALEPPIPTTRGVIVRGDGAELLEFPGGSRMQLLAEDVGTTTTISAHRSLLRAGAEGANPHHHEGTTHLFFVVSGSVELMMDDRVMQLGAGDLAVIPPGVTHAFRAAGQLDADVLDVVTPGGERFEMFRQFARAANGGGLPATSFDDPVRFDTYADDRPEWRATQQHTASGS